MQGCNIGITLLLWETTLLTQCGIWNYHGKSQHPSINNGKTCSAFIYLCKHARSTALWSVFVWWQDSAVFIISWMIADVSTWRLHQDLKLRTQICMVSLWFIFSRRCTLDQVGKIHLSCVKLKSGRFCFHSAAIVSLCPEVQNSLKRRQSFSC